MVPCGGTSLGKPPSLHSPNKPISVILSPFYQRGNWLRELCHLPWALSEETMEEELETMMLCLQSRHCTPQALGWPTSSGQTIQVCVLSMTPQDTSNFWLFLCFLWSHRDFWIQLTPPFGTVDVPPCSSILSSPNSNCFLGPGLSKKSELEQWHSNPVYGLGAQLASALGLMNLYLGTSKPHRLQTTGHGWDQGSVCCPLCCEYFQASWPVAAEPMVLHFVCHGAQIPTTFGGQKKKKKNNTQDELSLKNEELKPREASFCTEELHGVFNRGKMLCNSNCRIQEVAFPNLLWP